ncbi:MAG: prolipoprotein diacylglyceryl transferase [Deltaproteobacteria bacterium]|nr:prolipoprotein diacylglyceryl transferase [Deltaproteobacteria bacterium]MBW2415084.1 prolipoprotein diacylglyceryl transferase [Deltaproteobacteria bacterium]
MYPVLFEPFGFAISSFGVLVALGFLAGGKLGEIVFRERGLDPDLAWRVMIYCMIGGVLGSKLWYAAEHVVRGETGTFIGFFLSRAGMTWYGGLVGGTFAGMLASRVTKVPFMTLANVTAIALAVGQCFGRIGCFLVGDDYGRRSEAAIAVAFPRGAPPTIDPLSGEVFSVLPTQLYEAGWLAAVGVWLWTRRKSSPTLFGEYLILAGAGRLWIELFRTNPAFLGPLTNAQVVAVGCILFGAVLWLAMRAREPGAAPA